nr:hypothetical protein [Tanacetum cinerariifolium]
MNPIASQQAALDNSMVALKKRLKIERCNARIAFTKLQKEETYQVTLEALKLSPCYPAFQITTEVPEIYMHQFWNTIKRIRNIDAYNFKLDKKNLGGHLLLSLTSASLGNQQDLIGSGYNLNNVDYVALPWEDFMYQADNRETSLSRKEHMPYPRFTKVIINHFFSKDNTISMRNMINLHTIRDDSLLGTLKFVSKTEYYQKYGALIPDEMINDDIKISTAFKTYLDYATRKVPPKKEVSSRSMLLPNTRLSQLLPKNLLKRGIELLFDAALLEDTELKKTLRKSKRESHKLQASGSSEGANFESNVIDEQTGKTKITSEGTGVKPGVLDVSKEDSSDSDDDSWGNSEEECDDFNDEDDNDVKSGNDDDNGYDDGGNDAKDSVQMDLDNDENPSFTLRDYDEEEQDEDQGLRDTDMTNVEQGREDPQNASHELGFVQQEDDGHTTQQYGAILPIELTTDKIRNSKAYNEYYACAMGEASPKPKASARKKKGESASSTTPPTPTPTTIVESAPRLSATAKGKQPARAITSTKPIDVQRTEAEQPKIALKMSRQETHISQQCGSGTDEGTGSKPGVPDVPSDDLEEELSWNSSDDEDVGGHEEGDKSDESDDELDEGSDDDFDETVKAGAGKDDDDNDDEDDVDNDEEEELAKNDEEDTESSKGGDEVSESEGKSDKEETRQEEEESFDSIPRTPKKSEGESNDEEGQELRLSEEARIQEEEDVDELYRDVNINQGRGLQVTQNVEDSHVTLTPVNPDGVESIFTTASSPIVSLQTPTPIMTHSTIATITTSSEAPIPPPTIPSIILENLLTFNSAFRFDERLRSLETSFSEYRQTNPFVDVVFAIPGTVHQYMTQQMRDAVREAVQIQTDRLQDSLQ